MASLLLGAPVTARAEPTPAEAQAEVSDLRRCGEKHPPVNPKTVRRLSGRVPEYPTAETRDQVCLVRVCVDKRGAVQSTIIGECAPTFARSVRSALSSWRYEPRRDGHAAPQRFETTVLIEFTRDAAPPLSVTRGRVPGEHPGGNPGRR